jgi:tripartite-type tricarboxylate transporter receptor subunit TctC
LVEAGYADLVITAWYGIVAPSGTPSDVINTLNKALNQALSTTSVRENLRSQGSEAIGGTPAQFADLLNRELDRWAGAVKASGAKVE